MTDQDTKPGVTLEIARILELLPHRYPFLMIDRMIQVQGDDFGIGIKNVTVNEPQFTGHFPVRPIFPGVLLIEGMAQSAGVLCLEVKHWPASSPPPLVYFMSIDKAKFRKPVVPGDVVEHRMTKLRRRGDIWRYRGELFVGGAKVAEAELTAMIVPS